MAPFDPAESRDTPGTPNYSKTRLIAVGWTILSSACLAVIWVIVRNLSERLHVFEISFFTAVFGIVVFLPWMFRVGASAFHTNRLGAHIARGTLNGGAILCWFLALTLMPLADAAALNLVMPLVVTIGAILFLGEKVRLRRWIALGVGAAGALVVVRPGFQDVNLGVWLVMGTVILSAFQRLIAKTVSRTESSATSVLYLMIFMIPVVLVPSLFVWKTPQPIEYAGLAAMGVLLSATHFCLMKSLKLADISALEPYNFTRLVWAALFGFVFFAEIPDFWTWVGGLMIITATSYLARREAALKEGTETEEPVPAIT